MDGCPLQWYACHLKGAHCNGLDWHPMHWSPPHANAFHSGQGTLPTPAREKDKRVRGRFHYNSGNATQSPGGENHAPMRCLRRRAGSRPSAHHTPSTSRPSTASAARTTAATTSSGPPWPQASSPRSNPAPARWRLTGERPLPNMASSTSAEPVYAITLHQPWASLIALGIKTVETRSWPAPARLVGRRIAVHAGKRLVRRPGDAIEQELRACLGDDWRMIVPTGAVVATAVLAGMAQVERADLLEGCAVHDPLPRLAARWERDEPPSIPGATSTPVVGCGSWTTWRRCRSRFRPSAARDSGIGTWRSGDTR